MPIPATTRARLTIAMASAVIVAASAATPIAQRLVRGPAPLRIEVGPNILVSHDGNVTHIEPHVGAHPNDPKKLVGSAIVNYEYGSRVASYASSDGGYSWTLAALSLLDAGDPQIAFGKTGTVLFASLGNLDDKASAGLYVSRSENNGLSWQQPVLVADFQDHPQMVVDHSTGRFSGHIYIGTLHGSYALGVARSTDDGRTWNTPIDFVNGGDRYGHNVANLLVLSDGTLFVPFVKWTRGSPVPGSDTSSWDFVLSTDGGETFTAPRRIRVDRIGDLAALPPRARRQQLPQFGIDSGGGVRQDRIYMAFPRIVDDIARVYVQFSDDRGTTWSEAKPIDSSTPAHAEQFNQMVTVNRQGVVGVTWFDTRASEDGSAFDEYFAASVDGGVTFLPPVRVSLGSIRPHAPGNLGVNASSSVGRGAVFISFDRSFGRLESGGDYLGLTADAEGIFHPLWPDTRTGAYRLYTAAIRVTSDRRVSAPADAVVREIKGAELGILFDPVSVDESTGIITAPLRVQNLTGEFLYGPLTIRFGVDPNAGDRGKFDVLNYPEIIGARNGKTGPGAEFDLTSLIGTTGVIPAGATTGQFMLRIKPQTPTGSIGRLTATLIATTARK
jgi:hypothetical protein